MKTQTKTRKLLRTALTVTVVGSIVAFGTFSAFSSSTENPNNNFAAGSVAISDNDTGTALYDVSEQKPGDFEESCIKVTYTGSLDSDVKLYLPDSVNSQIGEYLDLDITKGTGAAANCSDFVAAASPGVFSGELGEFASLHSDYASGLADSPAGDTKWETNDAVTYKVRVELQDTNSANSGSATGYSTGDHSYVWEARNQ